ncbi:MAG TPA: glycosyltransferase [Gemmataceae bacterium]|nr:glycosyltransferase [Gemmataceae bacterium]
MPPRIAYWTSAFEPEMEAIAAEVALLRRQFPGSVAWGLTHRHRLLLSWRRGYGLSPRLHLLFRAATRLLEPFFQLNHVFGSPGDWFYLEGSRRRPIVLTVATWTLPVEPALLRRVECFVVEHPGGRDLLKQAGIDPGRVRLIFPPVDLERFTPSPPPAGPFTVLFASSPDKAEWLEGRGVPQLLEAARLRPHMRFRLLWRPWGDSAPRVRQWIAERGLRNVELVTGCFPDMAVHYRQVHVTATPFTDLSRSKPAPNSLIESLACGRPVLVTETVGLAEVVREAAAGEVSEPTGPGLAEALDRLEADWISYSTRARRLAERYFGVGAFLRGYRRLYAEVLGAGRVSSRCQPAG